MTAHSHSVTVHTYVPSHLDAANVASTRSAYARSLIRSLGDPPETARTSSAWQWDPPEQPLPHTISYTTAPPLAASPSTLRNGVLARPPAAAEARTLPAFAHWTRPPSPPVLADLEATQQPTQGILKKRAGIAGGWAVAAAGGGGERKKVRVESPRSSEARTGVGVAVGVKDRGKARELVPPTPEQPVEVERERSNLAEGAVRRCLPYPYMHPVRAPRLTDTHNPTRQHAARVLHSFVDPSFVPVARSAPEPANITQTQGQTQPALPLSTTSPLTHAFLAPGRRGAWLLPLSDALPVPHTSPPVFFPRAPPPLPAEHAPGTEGPIVWTAARVRAVHRAVERLDRTGEWGVVRCSGYFPPDSHGGDSEWPEMLRVHCPAHLALPLRALLSLVTVRMVEGPEARDGERFLRGRGLLWVDEEGGEVLVA